MFKKFFLSLFSLGLLVPVGMSSSAKLANSKEVLAVSKETTRSSEKLTTYIPTYVQGNFTFKTAGSEEVVDASTIDSFKVDPITTTFWGDRHFNAPDYFFRGFEREDDVGKEGWTGTITTKEWVQKKRYVTVLIAGGKDPNNNYINVYTKKAGQEFESFRVANNNFSDPYASCNFVEKVITLPDTISDDDLASGITMKLEFVDNATEGFAFWCIGSLLANQTATDVARSLSVHMNMLSEKSDKDKLAKSHIINLYNTNAEFTPFTSLTLTDVGEDFEDGYGLTRLAYDSRYGTLKATANLDKAICSWYEGNGGAHMPYNKTGNNFFKGFYEGDNSSYPFSGFIAGDDSVYRLLTPSFTLSGTGLISFKASQAGASVHVLNGDSTSPNFLQELAFIDIKTFSTDGVIHEDINLQDKYILTMVRHVVNLEAFLGKKIVLGLADVSTGGWGAANFDEIVTYYPTAPSFKVDLVTHNECAGREYKKYARVLDKYVSKTATTASGDIIYTDAAPAFIGGDVPTTDTSVYAEAASFLSYYYSTFRDNNVGSTFCGVINNDQKVELGTRYNALSEGAKTIVDISEDYTRDVTDGNGQVIAEVSKMPLRIHTTVGQTVNFIVGSYNVSVAGLNLFAMMFGAENTNSSVILIIFLAVLAISVIGIVAFKRHKKVY